MSDNAQAMTASLLCLLPRILPAPQALLKPTRPSRLPTYKAQVVGIHSGMFLDSVGSFANIIHPLEDQPPLSFRVLKICHKEDCAKEGLDPTLGRNSTSWSAKLQPQSKSRTCTSSMPACSAQSPRLAHQLDKRGSSCAVAVTDIEMGSGSGVESIPVPRIQRRLTIKEHMTDFVANPILRPSPSMGSGQRPAVPPLLTSPIHIITVFSFVLTLVIIGLTAYWRDGNALLAVTIISLQASLVGYASWWKPQLTVRPLHRTDSAPPGDMMIRTREGAFVLILCSEDVARELYTGAEECEYHVGPTQYRCLMAAGTALLMVGVVLLGNTGFESQAIIAAGYIFLNGAYWLLGMLPKSHFWDLSRYHWEDVTPKDARNADKHGGGSAEPSSLSCEEESPSFTRTLWYAIRETGGQTWWVERSGAAPSTPQWKQWLREAGEMAAHPSGREWNAVSRKNEIMKDALEQMRSRRGEAGQLDMPEQRAPATVPDGKVNAVAASGSL